MHVCVSECIAKLIAKWKCKWHGWQPTANSYQQQQQQQNCNSSSSSSHTSNRNIAATEAAQTTNECACASVSVSVYTCMCAWCVSHPLMQMHSTNIRNDKTNVALFGLYCIILSHICFTLAAIKIHN